MPVDADTPSLLTQLQTLAERSNVDFRAITLSSGAAAPPATGATTATPTATATGVTAVRGDRGAAADRRHRRPGRPAGDALRDAVRRRLLRHRRLLRARSTAWSTRTATQTSVDGRLLTIDGFNFAPGANGLPHLTATVSATSYLTPADQGTTAGATSAGPATGTPVATPPAAPAAPAPATSAAVVAN